MSEMYTLDRLSEVTVLLPADGGSLHDEVQEDSVNRMWSEYLEDVKEFDKELTDAWREDANGLLTCTAIFSAIVAAFITQSNNMLSTTIPGTSTDSQAALLISYSLAIPLNCIWLLSFLLSTTAALLATSIQHWARRYIQLPKIRSMPSDRARVRSFLFFGTTKYDIHRAVEIAPKLLHLSVLLFNAGLVIYFIILDPLLGMIVFVFFVLFGVAYLTLTILPCIDRACPYSTPLSSISWNMWHSFAFLAEYLFQGILRPLDTILAPRKFGRQRTFNQLLDRITSDLNMHKQYLRDGLQGSIVKDALRAPPATDTKALNWLFQLLALARKRKIERFVACLPGATIIQLLNNPPEDGQIAFREHLSALLRSCMPGTVELDEHTRRHRLLACLDAVHHVARASTIPNGVILPPCLLNDVRIKFANIPLMRALWAEKDPAIRLTARSICALFARHLLREPPLEKQELAWLQDVMGQPPNTISERFNNLPLADDMIVDSFVYGVLSDQTDDFPIIQVTSFVETLAILMNLGTQTIVDRDEFADKLDSLIRRIEGGGHQDRDNVVKKLRGISQNALPIAETQPQTPSLKHWKVPREG